MKWIVKWLRRLWYGKPKPPLIPILKMPDGKYVILRGHRRMEAARRIMEME